MDGAAACVGLVVARVRVLGVDANRRLEMSAHRSAIFDSETIGIFAARMILMVGSNPAAMT